MYPTAHFRALTIKDPENTKRDNALKEAKRLLEKKIRNDYPEPIDYPAI